jgi:AAA15 family ATPase/GTPase
VGDIGIFSYICEKSTNSRKMLVEFSVANFRSIKDKQTLSLLAAPIVSKEEKVDESNVIKTQAGIRLLKSIGIYGANASGKSNLVKAMMIMMNFIDKSFQDEDYIQRFEPFALDRKYIKQPMHFELAFLMKETLYRYGFEITGRKITAEWLFGPAKKNEVAYFTRNGNEINVNKTSFKEGVDLTEGKTRDTTLFLNVVHAFNGAVAKEIKDFLRFSMVITSGVNDAFVRDRTLQLFKDGQIKQQILDFMKGADFGIQEINHVDIKEIKFPSGVAPVSSDKKDAEKQDFVLLSLRKIKNAPKGELPLAFIFDQFESEGTKRFLTYAGPIIEILHSGGVLVIDEFDARLHPTLTRRIVELFNSKEHNPKNAQLIFVTHDINLLDPSLLRRDQIYFAEKNLAGETSLYSLINVGGVRNDASYENDYMKGKYGALQYLKEFNIQ